MASMPKLEIKVSLDSRDLDSYMIRQEGKSMQTERRANGEAVSIRSDDGTRTVTGYAAVFNSRSNDLGGWFEVIKPGAFSRSLASGMEVRGLFNHDANLVLGSTKSGTVRLSEDSRGLRYEIDLPKTTYANDLAELIERGDVRGSSFAFLPTENPRWVGDVREVTAAELYDVSIVTSPAYDAAQVVSMRARQDYDQHKSRIELYRRKSKLLGWY